MESDQQVLWHDTFRDALRDLVSALGGFKKVGARLWPAKPVDEAGRHLADCLNAAKPHKLSLEEIEWLLCEGRRVHCHIGMYYLTNKANYEEPKAVDPETAVQRLQREFVMAVQHLSKIQIELGAKAADVAQMRRVA